MIMSLLWSFRLLQGSPLHRPVTTVPSLCYASSAKAKNDVEGTVSGNCVHS